MATAEISGTRPAPLASPETDVRELDGFLLNVERLLASELWALSTGEEFKAAVGLWCRAWKQLPAGSLPNDDRILASFAGVTSSRWKKVKTTALRGFVECSDGRLYHYLLAEDARRAAAKMAGHRERTKAATDARRNDQRNDQRNDPKIPRNRQRNVVPVSVAVSKKSAAGSDLGEGRVVGDMVLNGKARPEDDGMPFGDDE